LRRAYHSFKESYRLQIDHETENQGPGPKGAVESVKKGAKNTHEKVHTKLCSDIMKKYLLFCKGLP
jgi:hypothetical protein